MKFTNGGRTPARDREADRYVSPVKLYHDALASLWCQWNAQRGTAKQIAAVQRQLMISDLERMLTERGVALPKGTL